MKHGGIKDGRWNVFSSFHDSVPNIGDGMIERIPRIQSKVFNVQREKVNPRSRPDRAQQRRERITGNFRGKRRDARPHHRPLAKGARVGNRHCRIASAQTGVHRVARGTIPGNVAHPALGRFHQQTRPTQLGSQRVRVGRPHAILGAAFEIG